MKNLIVALFSFVCLTGLQAQDGTNISAGILYSGTSGLNMEVGGRLSISGNWGINASASSNFHHSNSFRSGLDYRFIKKSRFYARIGLGYHFESYKFDGSLTEQEHNLEIPLSIGIKLMNNFDIVGAIIPAIKGSKADENYFIDNIRLGLTYRLK